MSKKLDFIVFGATGFTGKLVVKELAIMSRNENFTWGIAGRSLNKLSQVLSLVENETGK